MCKKALKSERTFGAVQEVSSIPQYYTYSFIGVLVVSQTYSAVSQRRCVDERCRNGHIPRVIPGHRETHFSSSNRRVVPVNVRAATDYPRQMRTNDMIVRPRNRLWSYHSSKDAEKYQITDWSVVRLTAIVKLLTDCSLTSLDSIASQKGPRPHVAH